jgi:UDP-N-acetylmuramate dehydrogenase
MSSGPSTESEWRATLEALCRTHGLVARVDEPLRGHSTWRIGGTADVLLEPVSWSQVGALLRCADEHGIAALVIGKGSNLLFADAGLRGMVIKIGRHLAGLSCAGTTVHAQAGVSASRLARAAGLAGLTGLEHIVGIPGTLGGLVVMNGGSLRQAIGAVIVEVETMDRRGIRAVRRGTDCEFAYRQSRFQREDCVITEIVLELARRRQAEIMADMRAILRERRRRFPLTLPSCGSVFKSDPQLYGSLGPTGAIIERLGFKGRRVGDAVVDSRHANFIVNVGAARACDVLELVGLIRQTVQERFGHTLACEAKYVDEQARVRPLDACLPEA